MKNVNFDVYEYIINLVKQGYDVYSISKTLNLEKSYVVSMLRKIRSDIVSSMDEESFYLISMIDVLLKKKIKNVTRNFGGTKRNQIFDMLCDGESYIEIISLLNISLSVYLSLLKAMYIDLYNYGSYSLQMIGKYPKVGSLSNCHMIVGHLQIALFGNTC